MKGATSLLLGLALTTLVACDDAKHPRQLDLSKASEYFQQFQKEYGKAYSCSEEEEERFQIFQENMKLINEANLRMPLALFAINKFADYKPEEIPEGLLPV